MFVTKKEVFNCIAKALKLNPKKINIDSNSDNTRNWDSLGQLNIITELDKKLKGKTFRYVMCVLIIIPIVLFLIYLF